jgi:MFS family permease
VLAEIRAGFGAVYRHPQLRPLAQAIAAHFVCSGLVWSVLILFASRELGLSGFAIGAIYSASGAGLLLGSLLAASLAARLGVGRTAVLGVTLVALGVTLSVAGGGRASVTMLALGNFAVGLGLQVHGINTLSLRQRITGGELLGRVNATFRFGNLAAAATGALLAAALASAGLGSRGILAVGAVAFWAPPLILARALSALRGLIGCTMSSAKPPLAEARPRGGATAARSVSRCAAEKGISAAHGLERESAHDPSASLTPGPGALQMLPCSPRGACAPPPIASRRPASSLKPT